MTLTPELIKEKIEMLRSQALFIQATKPDERSQQEREWLAWAERRINALQKEAVS